ncbi:hypothetical protein ACNKHO_14255 [Shigella flexneri]
MKRPILRASADRYLKKDLDAITSNRCMDWEALVSRYDPRPRNSTLSALMPSETSSQISNATNGIEPPRGYVSIKASKTVFCVRWFRTTNI